MPQVKASSFAPLPNASGTGLNLCTPPTPPSDVSGTGLNLCTPPLMPQLAAPLTMLVPSSKAQPL